MDLFDSNFFIVVSAFFAFGFVRNIWKEAGKELDEEEKEEEEEKKVSSSGMGAWAEAQHVLIKATMAKPENRKNMEMLYPTENAYAKEAHKMNRQERTKKDSRNHSQIEEAYDAQLKGIRRNYELEIEDLKDDAQDLRDLLDNREDNIRRFESARMPEYAPEVKPDAVLKAIPKDEGDWVCENHPEERAHECTVKDCDGAGMPPKPECDCSYDEKTGSRTSIVCPKHDASWVRHQKLPVIKVQEGVNLKIDDKEFYGGEVIHGTQEEKPEEPKKKFDMKVDSSFLDL